MSRNNKQSGDNAGDAMGIVVSIGKRDESEPRLTYVWGPDPLNHSSEESTRAA